MAKVKGIGKEMLIRVFRKYGKNLEDDFLQALTPDRRACHLNTHGIRWEEIDLDEKRNPLAVAANIIFPNEHQNIRKLGTIMAKDGFVPIYKIFFKFPSLTSRS